MATMSAPGDLRPKAKKLLNVELNLVPFIDLFTCLVCFLLMAAVWVQVGKLSVSQSDGLSNHGLYHEARFQLVITVLEDALLITGNGSLIAEIMKKDHQYDYMKLGQKLVELRSTLPELHDLTVASEDAVEYQDLVNTIDVCMTNGFDDVSISSAF